MPLSDDEQEELERLAAEYDELVDTDDKAETDRLREIEQRIGALEAQMQQWPAETLAVAGAIVSIWHDGDLHIERGLVRPETFPLTTPVAMPMPPVTNWTPSLRSRCRRV